MAESVEIPLPVTEERVQLRPNSKDKPKKEMKDRNDDSFFSKVKSALIKAGIRVIYAAFLLRVVLKRKETPLVDKVIITIALTYFAMPWDAFPDIIPSFGYTDDLAVLLGAMKIVSNNITPDVEEEAKDDFKNVFGFSPDA